MRRRTEVDDMLNLLAALAQEDDYEPPAERITELLENEDRTGPVRATDPEERMAQVRAFIIAAGGNG
jgi:hypothetical protein